MSVLRGRIVLLIFGFSNTTSVLVCFFFFQAEDGIRDGTVTGAQTCALPIWACAHPGRRRIDADAVPELGLQPDRGEAGAAGRTADAAGIDTLRRRVAGV